MKMNCTNSLLLVGRIIIGSIFIIGGVTFILNFENSIGFVGLAFPIAPTLFLVGAILCKILGGLSLILGYYVRIGAIILIVFTVVATFAYHNVFINPMESIAFTKNLMVIGGLLFLIAAGSGKYSIKPSQ